MREKVDKINDLSAIEYGQLITEYSEDKFCQIPNPDIIKWAEISHDNCVELARMNDGGQDFLKIADHVESQY